MAQRFVLAVVLVACSLVTSAAMATDACYYVGYGYSPSDGNAGIPGFNQERHPYFAMYPPVYYNGIEPRSYGQSPYAYLPPVANNGTSSVPAAADGQPSAPVRPLMVRNPYYSGPFTAPIVSPPAPRP